MHLMDFIDIADRRGLLYCKKWLLEYATVRYRQTDHIANVTPRSAGFMKLKSMFDLNEFERVVSLGQTSDHEGDRDIASLVLLSSLLIFQKEQRGADIQIVSASSSRQQGMPPNADYQYAFLRKLAENTHSRFSNDAVVNFIYAMVLRERPDKGDSSFICELLIRSIKQAPFNWASWHELGSCDEAITEENETFLKKQELYQFYRIEKLKRLKKFKHVISEVAKCPIREWSYLDGIEASCYHDLRNFPASAAAFERIRNRDLFDVEGMDEYSNCLFVLEREQDLSQLASHTGVIVGNHFSLKGDHEKAALFFKRATVVDPLNMNAWLLLGHELIELRNPSAAFAAYQQAAQCPNAARDMRPWYAMGQLFELINQMAFAVFYHNKAIQIQPKDPRIWKALSGCYLKLNRADESQYCNAKVKTLSSDPAAMAM